MNGPSSKDNVHSLHALSKVYRHCRKSTDTIHSLSKTVTIALKFNGLGSSTYSRRIKDSAQKVESGVSSVQAVTDRNTEGSVSMLLWKRPYAVWSDLQHSCRLHAVNDSLIFKATDKHTAFITTRSAIGTTNKLINTGSLLLFREISVGIATFLRT